MAAVFAILKKGLKYGIILHVILDILAVIGVMSLL